MNAGGILTNTVTVTDSVTAGGVTQDDDDTGKASTTIVQNPDLSIAKDTSDPTVDGADQVIHYTIDVTNTGNVDLAGGDIVVTRSEERREGKEWGSRGSRDH